MTTGKPRPKIGTGQNSMKGRWSITNGQKNKNTQQRTTQKHTKRKSHTKHKNNSKI